jgi:hypothetical protein
MDLKMMSDIKQAERDIADCKKFVADSDKEIGNADGSRVLEIFYGATRRYFGQNQSREANQQRAWR